MIKDKELTMKRIYDAFLEILEEDGPHSVGINAIAKKAGVSKQLIYRYFGGMKGLLLEYAKNGDFFRPLLMVKEKDDKIESDLSSFLNTSLQELRSHMLTQEILRWQLIENNENTKDLFRFTNLKLGKVFANVNKDLTELPEFQLMIGGYIYFVLLSKYNKKFININLIENDTWDAFDDAMAKMVERLEDK